MISKLLNDVSLKAQAVEEYFWMESWDKEQSNSSPPYAVSSGMWHPVVWQTSTNVSEDLRHNQGGKLYSYNIYKYKTYVFVYLWENVPCLQ